MNLKHLQNGSDIRGVALDTNPEEPVTLSKDEVKRLSRAFGTWLRRKLKKNDLTVAVGRDSRLSGHDLAQAAEDGLVFDGADVFDTGLSSTPAMFMATIFDEIDADGSIMITASHLPENRNGMKFFYKGGGLDAKDIEEIIKIAEEEDFIHRTGGSLTSSDLMKIYAEHLRDIIKERMDTDEEKPLDGLHIVIDAGNGAGGFFATQVLEPLGANIEGSQFLNPDGSFPNHIPNPENKEAMEALIQAVKDNHADLGLIFDTDVDRSSAVDENGNPVGGNDLIALASLLASKRHPHLTVVTDSVTSDELKDFLDEKGIEQHRFKRGYRNVINEAKRLNEEEGKDAALAIETSGHAAFKDNYFLDDGAYLAAQIVVEAAANSISDLLKDLRHPAEEEDFRLHISEKAFKAYGEQVIEDLENYAKESESLKLVQPNYEGARIRFQTPYGNGWALIRMSLHESLMPVHLECENKKAGKLIARELVDFLSQYPSLDLTPIKKLLS